MYGVWERKNDGVVWGMRRVCMEEECSGDDRGIKR